MKRRIVLFIIGLVSGAAGQSAYFPPINGDDWHTVSAESLDWQPDSLAALQDFLTVWETRAFIILKDGRIAVEWYLNGFTQDKSWYWASAGKSLTAFLIGQAQEEGLLDISDKTSMYLGRGWTSCPPEKEARITLRHQLTMTTGLDDGVPDMFCTDASCLVYLADAGERWAYHNGPYTLLLSVLEAASGKGKNQFTRTHVLQRTGMTGLWLKTGENILFYSTARSMARYGWLIQNRGVWQSDTLMQDSDYFDSMTNTSQEFNKSYGYLWWLNGKGSYMLPQSRLVFNTDLIANAPDDLFAALGANDQKLYITDSLGLVVVRLGESAGKSDLALSSFDNDLWAKIMSLTNAATTLADDKENRDGKSLTASGGILRHENYPNPFNPATSIRFELSLPGRVRLQVYSIRGVLAATLADGFYPAGVNVIRFDAANFAAGVYVYRLQTNKGASTGKMILLR